MSRPTRPRRRYPGHSLGKDPRISRRRLGRPRRNRRRRRAPLILWLLAILTLEVVAVGLKDPRFNLARIEVQGGEVLTEEQVVRRSGLRPGINLFQTRLKEARSVCWRCPPSPMSRCTAACRTASSSACRSANRWRAWRQETPLHHRRDGIAFPKDAKPPRGLPLVTGMEPSAPTGGRIDERGRVPCVHGAAADYPQRGVPRVSIDQNGNLCFNNVD